MAAVAFTQLHAVVPEIADSPAFAQAAGRVKTAEASKFVGMVTETVRAGDLAFSYGDSVPRNSYAVKVFPFSAITAGTVTAAKFRSLKFMGVFNETVLFTDHSGRKQPLPVTVRDRGGLGFTAFAVHGMRNRIEVVEELTGKYVYLIHDVGNEAVRLAVTDVPTLMATSAERKVIARISVVHDLKAQLRSGGLVTGSLVDTRTRTVVAASLQAAGP